MWIHRSFPFTGSARSQAGQRVGGWRAVVCQPAPRELSVPKGPFYFHSITARHFWKTYNRVLEYHHKVNYYESSSVFTLTFCVSPEPATNQFAHQHCWVDNTGDLMLSLLCVIKTFIWSNGFVCCLASDYIFGSKAENCKWVYKQWIPFLKLELSQVPEQIRLVSMCIFVTAFWHGWSRYVLLLEV